MPEPVTSLVGGKLLEKGGEKLGEAVLEGIKHLFFERLSQGSFPKNDPLAVALRESLCRTVIAFGYIYYEKKREKAAQGLGRLKNLLDKYCGLLLKRMIADDPTEQWVDHLLEVARETGAFDEVAWWPDGDELVVATRVQGRNPDLIFRRHLETTFLSWVEIKVDPRADTQFSKKPLDFEDKVCRGWEVPGPNPRISFFWLFCQYVQETLANNAEAFHSYQAKFNSSIIHYIEFAKVAVEQQTQLLVDLTIEFQEYREAAESDRQKLLEQLTVIIQRVALLVARSDEGELTRIDQTLVVRLGSVSPIASNHPQVDLSDEIYSFAQRHNISIQLAELVLKRRLAIALAEKHSLEDTARLNFIAQDFQTASNLYVQAAAKQFTAAQQALEQYYRLSHQRVESLIRAGETLRILGKPAEANLHFSDALSIVVSLPNSDVLRAEVEHWLGTCHYDLGCHAVGGMAQAHFANAIHHLNAALVTRKEVAMSTQFASTVRRLGTVFYQQGQGKKDEEKDRLLGDAISCYGAALRVYKPTENLMEFILTSSNFGLALIAQAETKGKKSHSDAEWLLGEAVGMFRDLVGKLDPYPERQADILGNLGYALHIKGKFSGAGDAKRYYEEVIAIYRRVLSLYGDDPTADWARIQNNLGDIQKDLAELAPRASSEQTMLFQNAIAAFDRAEIVRQYDKMPAQRAVTTFNKAETRLAEARVSDNIDRKEALLRRAREDFSKAEDVFTLQNYSDYHREIQERLAEIDRMLEEILRTNHPDDQL